MNRFDCVCAEISALKDFISPLNIESVRMYCVKNLPERVIWKYLSQRCKEFLGEQPSKRAVSKKLCMKFMDITVSCGCSGADLPYVWFGEQLF